MPGKFYDEFVVGEIIIHGFRRTVTESDNVLFCCITHNPQPLHMDAEYAKQTEFGQIVVNSMYTIAMATGVTVEDTTQGTVIANLGFKEILTPNPVFIGDTLRVQTEVLDKRESKSRPNDGIVTMKHIVHNQRDEVVCTIVRVVLIKKSA
jgi:acyl dehydratase